MKFNSGFAYRSKRGRGDWHVSAAVWPAFAALAPLKSIKQGEEVHRQVPVANSPPQVDPIVSDRSSAMSLLSISL